MSNVLTTLNEYPDLVFTISFSFGLIVGFFIAGSFCVLDEFYRYLRNKRTYKS